MLNLPKETEVAHRLMGASCEKCFHGHYPYEDKFEYGYVVCDISGERCLDDEICEDFVHFLAGVNLEEPEAWPIL